MKNMQFNDAVQEQHKREVCAKFQDADTGLFFLRELEYIKSRTYDVKYPELKARKLIPVSNEGGAGITNITYSTYDKAGKFGFVGSNSKDLVRSDVNGRQTTLPVHQGGGSFGYTIYEIDSARFANIPLQQRKADAVRRGYEQFINTLAYFGDSERNITGFLNNPFIPTGNSPAIWTASTPAAIQNSLAGAAGSIYANTLMVWAPDTLLLPVDKWNYIMNTPWSSTQASDTTIAQFFVKNNQFIRSLDNIIAVNELKGAGTGGTDIMVMYKRDPEVMELAIPMEIQYLPVQIQGLEFITPAYSYIAGTNIFYPNAAFILEGI